MANLVVRHIDNEVVEALRARAGQHGVSAEAEYRKILEQALLRSDRVSLNGALKSHPAVGEDADFVHKATKPVSDTLMAYRPQKWYYY